MPAANPRAERLATELEAAQADFIRLVETLTPAQWRVVGANYPQRFNDEDEGRPVGVIAHHVAVSGPVIMDRIRRMSEGRDLPSVDFRAINAGHAAEHAAATREEVLGLLRDTGHEIAGAVRGIEDGRLDRSRDTPAGPLSVAQRLERVLIGHLRVHQGSIEAAIAAAAAPVEE
ncbi:MAG: DinB family protein [Candidatus Dormibacteraceae bacterium]